MMVQNMPMEVLVDYYNRQVNQDLQLREYRDWVEQSMFGFGERCFYWTWKLLIDAMPQEFTFLEVGVFRGQILGLIELLAKRSGKSVKRYGITPLDSSDGHWMSDYAADIEKLHDTFGIAKDYVILKGSSTDSEIIKQASNLELDCLYIDGGHTYDVVVSDLINYPPLVKLGGYLVVDDCNNAHEMPFGYFRGIDAVSKAVDERFPPATFNPMWAFEYNIVHNRILKRI